MALVLKMMDCTEVVLSIANRYFMVTDDLHHHFCVFRDIQHTSAIQCSTSIDGLA